MSDNYVISHERVFEGTSDDLLKTEIYRYKTQFPQIMLTCADKDKMNYPGEESVTLSPETARELAAYLLMAADEAEKIYAAP